MIDPTAIIDPSAEIGTGVTIGSWAWIGPGVEIGSGTHIGHHCVVKGPTTLGSNNRIFPFCSIGEDPQDKKFEPGGESRLEIGHGNTIREYCSINRGTAVGGGVTRLGNDNWLMSYCHIAHDCQVANHTVFANNASLAGHVEIDDFVILGGFTGVHQFCRLGEGSFSAIASVIVRDVPPFVIVKGNTARPRTINSEGLKRRDVDRDSIAAVKRSFRALYRQGLGLEEAIGAIELEAAEHPHARQIFEFIRASKRGIVR